MSEFLPVKHQQQGVSLRTFSEQTGIREGQLLHYARKGCIIGARKHPLTKKWWIYPPAKLVMSGGEAYTPRSKAAKPGNSDAGGLPPRAVAVAFDVAVDVGISPHGLSAGLLPAVQETGEAVELLLSGRPPLQQQAETRNDDTCFGFPVNSGVSPGALPDVFTDPEIQATIRGIKREAREAHYPLVLSGSQMKLVEQAISDAIDGAIEALDCEPAECHREIKPYFDAYNQIYLVLKAAKAARKTANENSYGRDYELPLD